MSLVIPNHSEFLVYYRGCPIRFVENTQRVWSVCHEVDATVFTTEAAAYDAIRKWGLASDRDAAVLEIPPILHRPSSAQ